MGKVHPSLKDIAEKAIERVISIQSSLLAPTTHKVFTSNEVEDRGALLGLSIDRELRKIGL